MEVEMQDFHEGKYKGHSGLCPLFYVNHLQNHLRTDHLQLFKLKFCNYL